MSEESTIRVRLDGDRGPLTWYSECPQDDPEGFDIPLSLFRAYEAIVEAKLELVRAIGALYPEKRHEEWRRERGYVK